MGYGVSEVSTGSHWSYFAVRIPANSRTAFIMGVAQSSLIIFLDWDNTVCPTGYLKKRCKTIDIMKGNYTLKPNVEDKLNALDHVLACFAKQYAEYLSVLTIITRSDPEWVRQSAKRLLPELWKLFYSVRIRSTRTQPNTTDHEGKVSATTKFDVMWDSFPANTPQVLSMGDTEEDERATKQMPAQLYKFIRFIPDNPSPTELIAEWSRAMSFIPKIMGETFSVTWDLGEEESLWERLEGRKIHFLPPVPQEL